MAGPERVKKTHALLAALAHPARRRLLRSMADGKAISPGDLAEQLGMPLPTVSHHMRALARCDAVTLVGTRRLRGSIQHLYRSSVKATWAREVLEETNGEAPGLAS